MKKILFLFLFALASCHKSNDCQPSKVIPDMTGVWETDAEQIPGWIFGFRVSGEFCQLEKTITANPDCDFTWNQSNDSVWIKGDKNRLWIVRMEPDSSVVIREIGSSGETKIKMRLIQ